MKTWNTLLLLLLPFIVCAGGGGGKTNIRPGELALKLNKEYSQTDPLAIPVVAIIFREAGVTSCKKLFPHHEADARFPLTANRIDLSVIYHITLPPGGEASTAKRLAACKEIAYAEPLYVNELAYTPNDPDLSQQYFLGTIHAYAGWDISRGDTNTVIGIVDSGTDWDHPDLQTNIELNYADPINGMDDDGDGYIDNFRGWDISDNDNDPTVGVQAHGSHVSGCASAATDNAIGVAGPGFRCRLLAVKAAHDASFNTIDNGYEGIVYAADHGCSVINCSWGRRGGPSQLEQDVIDYATFNRNALVVAAAGNQSADALFYPASYEHVLSVTATDINDERASYSNFNYTVDVCAPGDAIYSTRYDNSYATQSGTSMASPVAAGCAAIVRSYNPFLTPEQTAARLRSTSDDIYGVGSNSTWQRKLGKGRINLYRALTDTLQPGIGVSRLVINDNNDGTFLVNDTLRISAVFTNLLHATSSLIITLSSSSPYIVLQNNIFSIGTLATLQSDSNRSIPFRARISGSTPLNTPVDFVMTMTDGSYSDYYAFSITVNVDYLNVTVNDVSTSVNSKGRIGYNKQNQVEGLGFTYLDDNTLLFSAGLMIGQSSLKVSDAVQGASSVDDDDFSILSILTRKTSALAPFVASGKFSDAASVQPLPVQVSQYVYAWDDDPHRKYVIVKYVIRNSGAATMTGIWSGIYADWDISDYLHNRSSTDLLRKMGYAWSTDTSLYTAIKVVSPTAFNHYAVDNTAGGAGGLDLSDGFTTAEKYTALSTSRNDAGFTGSGQDIIDIVSTGPFVLAAGDSVVTAFALLAGDSLAGLQSSADDAQQVYDSLLTAVPPVTPVTSFSIDGVYPNPAGTSATVQFSLDGYGDVTLSMYDVTGRNFEKQFSGQLPPGRYSMPLDFSGMDNGVYFLRLLFESRSVTVPVMVMHER